MRKLKKKPIVRTLALAGLLVVSIQVPSSAQPLTGLGFAACLATHFFVFLEYDYTGDEAEDYCVAHGIG